MMIDVLEVRPTLANDSVLMGHVLRAYKPHCQYLKQATLSPDGDLASGQFLASEASFNIPESCYIDDTGHFNSVEFNICYNQLMYYTIAKSVKEKASSFFDSWTLDQFWQKQLPDILIVDFKSKFKRPINPRAFHGSMEFTKACHGPGFLHMTTQCRFWDDSSGFSEGAVNLAIINAPN